MPYSTNQTLIFIIHARTNSPLHIQEMVGTASPKNPKVRHGDLSPPGRKASNPNILLSHETRAAVEDAIETKTDTETSMIRNTHHHPPISFDTATSAVASAQTETSPSTKIHFPHFCEAPWKGVCQENTKIHAESADNLAANSRVIINPAPKTS